MAEVAVGECVAGGFEPDDDGVDFGEGADEGVVDVVPDYVGRQSKAGGDVEGVEDPDEGPGGLELGELGFGGTGGS